jgi:hypothetical protein
MWLPLDRCNGRTLARCQRSLGRKAACRSSPYTCKFSIVINEVLKLISIQGMAPHVRSSFVNLFIMMFDGIHNVTYGNLASRGNAGRLVTNGNQRMDETIFERYM